MTERSLAVTRNFPRPTPTVTLQYPWVNFTLTQGYFRFRYNFTLTQGYQGYRMYCAPPGEEGILQGGRRGTSTQLDPTSLHTVFCLTLRSLLLVAAFLHVHFSLRQIIKRHFCHPGLIWVP